MKLLVVCIVLTVAVLVSCEWSAEEKKVFREWVKTHKKQYKSQAEETAALEKFMVAVKEVEEHNKLYDEGKVSFKKKLWEYSDMSHEEKRKYLHGVKVPDDLMRQTRAATNYPTFPAGPKSIDWVKRGLVSTPRQQGACGSCWAFSSAAIVEAAIRKKRNNKALISPQQLVDCSHYGTTGCTGGWPEYALDYIKANGVTDEEDYPYKAYEGTCEYTPAIEVATVSNVYNIPTRGNETWMK